jgi:hypothetical protein
MFRFAQHDNPTDNMSFSENARVRHNKSLGKSVGHIFRVLLLVIGFSAIDHEQEQNDGLSPSM